MKPVERRAYDLLHKGALALAKMEQIGMSIDLEYCEKEDRRLTKKMNRQYNKLMKTEVGGLWLKAYGKDINIKANDQLAHVLYKDMGLKAKVFTKHKDPSKRKPSTSYEALEALRIPELKIISQWRKYQNAQSTYLGGLLRETGEDSILHPFFHLNTVITFRGSSSAPNFQNIPVRDEEIKKCIRRAFIARYGRRMLEVDFGGLEVKIGACYHQDPTMIAYLNGQGDMHQDEACSIFKLDSSDVSKEIRFYTKNQWVFPEFYGSYWAQCAPNIWGIIQRESLTLASGQPLIDHLKEKGLYPFRKFESHIKKCEAVLWGERFPVYAQWKRDWMNAYERNGYFDTLTGFRCQGVMKRNDVTNYPVQGSAFHCLLQSAIWLIDEIKDRRLKTYVIGQIHDSLVNDVPAEECCELLDLIYEITTERLAREWKWIIVPLEVEAEATPINGSWYEKTDVNHMGEPCICGSHWNRLAPEVDGLECLGCGEELVPF